MSSATSAARRASIAPAAVLAACAGAALLAAGGATAADNGLFASTEPLVLRLAAPFSTNKNPRVEPEYEHAKLQFPDAGGTRTVDVRVRVRGKSRAQACDFPPLLINFSTSDLVGTLFEGEDKLKLVTHCRVSDSYDQYLLLEYLTYRTLNLLTDMSLRARMLKVTYYDTERRRVIAERPAMFIEDEQRFAERKGLKKVGLERIDPARYDRGALGLVEMFEYFIGNTDWSALAGPQGSECCHNVVPYQRADGMLVPVPYDFDSAGIVNVPYALPDARLRIVSVKERLYRGATCEPVADLEPRLAKYDALRPQIFELFSMSSGLEKSYASNATSYVNQFFATRSDPKKIERAFRSGCKS